jgi:hypothetical protein
VAKLTNEGAPRAHVDQLLRRYFAPTPELIYLNRQIDDKTSNPLPSTIHHPIDVGRSP